MERSTEPIFFGMAIRIAGTWIKTLFQQAPTMERSAAYQQGYDAYLIPFWRIGSKNRHPTGSHEWDEWWAGYNHAQADCAW